MILTAWSIASTLVLSVFSNRQPFSQMSAWKTSKQRLPIALDAATPVIFSAAGLKLVITRSLSTVKIPSAIELNITLKNFRSFDCSSIYFSTPVCFTAAGASFIIMQQSEVMFKEFDK